MPAKTSNVPATPRRPYLVTSWLALRLFASSVQAAQVNPSQNASGNEPGETGHGPACTLGPAIGYVANTFVARGIRWIRRSDCKVLVVSMGGRWGDARIQGLRHAKGTLGVQDNDLAIAWTMASKQGSNGFDSDLARRLGGYAAALPARQERLMVRAQALYQSCCRTGGSYAYFGAFAVGFAG